VNVASPFPAISLSIVLVALCMGVYTDITTRTCPRWIWSVCAPFAIISTICWYIQSLIIGASATVLPLFLSSVILCPFCMFMGYRMGNGGDWRSLFYISLATPWVSVMTLVLSCIVGLVQIGYYALRNRKLDTWRVTVPWMVSITIAFVISTFAYFFI
jgi:Flp pilus assembly protein protease CpaA